MQTLLDISMAIGPCIGYVHQYYIINRNKSTGTFSIDICGILLFANILRLSFYVFNKYAIALLWQSLIMICAQICLVHICKKYKNKKQDDVMVEVPSNGQPESISNLQTFWRWSSFSTYILFVSFFILISFTITLTFKQMDIQAYGVFIGLIALVSESVLILPQIMKNHKNKSTEGLSYLLVGLNLFGDIYKLVYFIVKSQAFQFILCGVIQVCLDSYVIFQIFLYRGNNLVQEKDHNRSIADKQKEKYSVDDEIKPETENNLNEKEIKNPLPQENMFEADPIQENEQQEEKKNPEAKDQELIQWKFQVQKKQQKKISNQKDVQKDKKANANIESNIDTITKPQSPQSNLQQQSMHIRKTVSYPVHLPISSTQFFSTDVSIPPKSLQNVKVSS